MIPPRTVIGTAVIMLVPPPGMMELQRRMASSTMVPLASALTTVHAACELIPAAGHESGS